MNVLWFRFKVETAGNTRPIERSQRSRFIINHLNLNPTMNRVRWSRKAFLMEGYQLAMSRYCARLEFSWAYNKARWEKKKEKKKTVPPESKWCFLMRSNRLCNKTLDVRTGNFDGLRSQWWVWRSLYYGLIPSSTLSGNGTDAMSATFGHIQPLHSLSHLSHLTGMTYCIGGVESKISLNIWIWSLWKRVSTEWC